GAPSTRRSRAAHRMAALLQARFGHASAAGDRRLSVWRARRLANGKLVVAWWCSRARRQLAVHDFRDPVDKQPAHGNGTRRRHSAGSQAHRALGSPPRGAQRARAPRRIDISDSLRVERLALIAGVLRMRTRHAQSGQSKEQTMSEPIWNQFLTERDKAVFATSGYGARQGFSKRPALIVIDVNYAFCGDKPEPILESIKRWRNCWGEDAWVALPYIRALIDKAHDKGLPVIYTTGVRRGDLWDSGSWAWKNNRSAEDAANKTVTCNLDGNEIMAEIAPGPR